MTTNTTPEAAAHVYCVSEIRGSALRRIHGYHATLQGAFAYCETEERKKPLIDTVRFELFPAPGGEQWLVQVYAGLETGDWPETSDLVISRHEVADEQPAASPVSVVSGQPLRDRVVAALYEARRPGLGGMSEAEAVAYMADAVMSALLPAVRSSAPAGDEDCERCEGSGLDPDAYFRNGDTWTHAPCSACQPEDDETALRRLATPAVLAVLPPDGHTTNRAAMAQWAADFAEDVAERLRAHHEFERANGALDVMAELRRLAAEAERPAVGARQPDTETPTAPQPADVPAVLREAADRIDATAFPPNPEDTFETGAHWATAELRRLAVEASTPEPVAHPTRYTVSHLGAHVTVEERDPGRWAVMDRNWCMSFEGQWHYEPRPSERDDLWLAEHRFDLDVALAMAKAALRRSTATNTSEETPRRCAHTDVVYGRCILPIPGHLDCFHERQPIRIDEETDEDSLCGAEYPGNDNFVGQLCGLPKHHFGDHRSDEEIAGLGHTVILRWRNGGGS